MDNNETVTDEVVKKTIFIKKSVLALVALDAKKEQRSTMHHAGVIIERAIYFQTKLNKSVKICPKCLSAIPASLKICSECCYSFNQLPPYFANGRDIKVISKELTADEIINGGNNGK